MWAANRTCPVAATANCTLTARYSRYVIVWAARRRHGERHQPALRGARSRGRFVCEPGRCDRCDGDAAAEAFERHAWGDVPHGCWPSRRTSWAQPTSTGWPSPRTSPAQDDEALAAWEAAYKRYLETGERAEAARFRVLGGVLLHDPRTDGARRGVVQPLPRA